MEQPSVIAAAVPAPVEPVKVKKGARDVFVEIAGGYLLGATIMSFSMLWMVGLINL